MISFRVDTFKPQALKFQAYFHTEWKLIHFSTCILKVHLNLMFLKKTLMYSSSVGILFFALIIPQIFGAMLANTLLEVFKTFYDVHSCLSTHMSEKPYSICSTIDGQIHKNNNPRVQGAFSDQKYSHCVYRLANSQLHLFIWFISSKILYSP